MSECKVPYAAPLDALDVGDRPGTSLTTPRALHRGPATARRPAGLCARGRAAARCRSTASSDGFGVALPTAPAGRRRPRSSREATPVEERRRGGGAQRRHGSSAGPLGSNACYLNCPKTVPKLSHLSHLSQTVLKLSSTLPTVPNGTNCPKLSQLSQNCPNFLKTVTSPKLS